MASIESQIAAALNGSGAFRPSWQGKIGTRPIRIREASWPADRMALETVRCGVFVTERNVPRTLEFDGRDANAVVVGNLRAALYSQVFTSAIGDLRDFTLALACFVLLMAWKPLPGA